MLYRISTLEKPETFDSLIHYPMTFYKPGSSADIFPEIFNFGGEKLFYLTAPSIEI